MALDPEELKKRRLERKKQAELRRKKNRKLMIRLVIAAAVLVGVIAGIVILVNRSGGTDTPGTDSQEPSEVLTETVPEPTEGATTVIHVAAAGDLTVTDQVVASGGGTYDYTETFRDVAYLLSDADLAVLNFEGLLQGDPYGSTHSAPQTMVAALDAAGVDLIQLANSYSIAKGMLGLSSTIDGIRAAGMEPLGVYSSQSDYDARGGYTLCQVKGIKIAFVAFTKGMDGMTLPAGSENCVNVLYDDYDSTYQDINRTKINAVLDAAQAEKPDIIIALLHWGSEYNDTISSSQESIRKLLQSRGVDAIIGTHSHYVQKMSLNEETGQFIAYSLGDFFGDAQRPGSEYSVILNLEITRDNANGDTRITNFTYTPIFTVTEPEKPMRVMRIHQAMEAYEAEYISAVSEETYKAMAYALERIEVRIKGE